MQNFGDESTNWVRRYVLFPRSLYHLEQGGRWQRIRLTVLSSAEARPHAWKWLFPLKRERLQPDVRISPHDRDPEQNMASDGPVAIEPFTIRF